MWASPFLSRTVYSLHFVIVSGLGSLSDGTGTGTGTALLTCSFGGADAGLVSVGADCGCEEMSCVSAMICLVLGGVLEMEGGEVKINWCC